MAKFRREAVAVIGASAALTVSIQGYAQTSEVRGGHCVYVVPVGSHVDALSGEVYLGRTYIGNYITDCNLDPSASPSTASGAAQPSGVEPLCVGGGGACTENSQCTCSGEICCNAANSGQCNYPQYQNVCCHTSPGSSCTHNDDCCGSICYNSICMDTGDFQAEDAAPYVDPTGNIAPNWNYIAGYWTVPPAPTVPADVEQEVLWFGFQSGAGIVQPELWYSGANGWTVDAQYGYNNHYTGLPAGDATAASVGDTIEGGAYLISGQTGSTGETWQVYVLDENNGSGGELGMSVTVPHGQFFTGSSSGNLGVLEVQGQSACAGLPNTPWVWFQIADLSQESTDSPTTFNDVRALVSPFAAPNPSSLPQVNCSVSSAWYYEESNAQYYGIVAWEP